MAKSVAHQKKAKKSVSDKLIKIAKPEWVFLILGIFFGLYFVFLNPPWQSNDEDRHFVHSYFIAKGYFVAEQGDNKIGGVIPVNVVQVPLMFQGIRFSDSIKISKSKLEELERIPLNPENKQFFHDQLYSYNIVGYIPNVIGIFLGQVINSNPVWLNWWGRIGGLAFYLVIIFFAIKFAPVYKNVLMLYALTPMPLYQGASVTYDILSISLTFLFFAVVLKYAFESESYITHRELLFIVLILLVQRFAKDGYPLLPFLFFVIPASKFKLKLKSIYVYLIMFVFCVALYYLPNWTWGKIIAAQGYHLEKSVALLKDLMKNQAMNIDYQMQNPGKVVSNIIGNINYFRQEWTGGTIGRFGYSYTLLPNWFFLLHGLILLSVGFLESKKEIVVRFWQKSIFFVVGVGSVLGIIVMSYFISPVGANMVFGLQGRYLIQAVPIILFLVYNSRFDFPRWNKWGVLILAGYIVFSLSYALMYLDDVFYRIP
ncbi:DUF2142 domain-containing protein [Bacteroidetes/Chlorobi group bacterium ChocPot_Mid]|jgi:uncharacterized membrane protein|nr:MAG: DUF2142 domain-containing protein [Bacteroidetes/Chlorobi group bacterium ChocPot_Mid]